MNFVDDILCGIGTGVKAFMFIVAVAAVIGLLALVL